MIIIGGKVYTATIPEIRLNPDIYGSNEIIEESRTVSGVLGPSLPPSLLVNDALNNDAQLSENTRETIKAMKPFPDGDEIEIFACEYPDGSVAIYADDAVYEIDVRWLHEWTPEKED